jgi:hypothetical protein
MESDSAVGGIGSYAYGSLMGRGKGMLRELTGLRRTRLDRVWRMWSSRRMGGLTMFIRMGVSST